MEPFEQEKHNVYRVDPKTGDIKVVVDDFVMPKALYVMDTGLTEGPKNPALSACSTSIPNPGRYRTGTCLPTISRRRASACRS